MKMSKAEDKPVYRLDDEDDETPGTPAETRIYEITLRVNVKDVPLTMDEAAFRRMLVGEVGRVTARPSEFSKLRDYRSEFEIVDAERIPEELEYDEHTPTLEHILGILKGEARELALAAARAKHHKVYGNHVY